MGERREYPRLAAALEARYKASGSVLDRRATITVLSGSGATFVAEEPLEPGSSLDSLRFTLGDLLDCRTFRLPAEIVSCEQREGIGRRDDYLIAVKFSDPSEDDSLRIHEFVLERLPPDDLAFNPRIGLDKPVAVRFERFDQFVEEVSKDLSRTGMFIRADSPRPPGSKFEFVLQLGEDFNLVQGRAEVVWNRTVGEGPDRPPGMGIRFLSLDRSSENVLRRLIERHVEPSYPRALGATAAPAEPDGRLPELPEELSEDSAVD